MKVYFQMAELTFRHIMALACMIHWEETTVIGPRGRRQELLVKEALHIQMTPAEERFNRDGGLEVPRCWTAVMRRQGGRSNPHRPLTSNDVYSYAVCSGEVEDEIHFVLRCPALVNARKPLLEKCIELLEDF